MISFSRGFLLLTAWIYFHRSLPGPSGEYGLDATKRTEPTIETPCCTHLALTSPLQVYIHPHPKEKKGGGRRALSLVFSSILLFFSPSLTRRRLLSLFIFRRLQGGLKKSRPFLCVCTFFPWMPPPPISFFPPFNRKLRALLFFLTCPFSALFTGESARVISTRGGLVWISFEHRLLSFLLV